MSKLIDKKFSEVISLFNSGKFIEAREIAKKILRLDSNNSSIMRVPTLVSPFIPRVVNVNLPINL